MNVPIDAGYARALDAQDVLASFRRRFVIDDPSLIYLNGNSLGRLPKASAQRQNDVVRREWGQRLIQGWKEGWFELPETVGSKLARLLGAAGDEVILADSTSVNVFKLAVAALSARPGRTKVVTDDLNFPSDIYILQGALRLLGGNHRLEIVRSSDGVKGPVHALLEAIDSDTALVALSHTVFKSGYTYDMQLITESAHRVGALVLWDTSHSVGALPIGLEECQVDLAVGCTYKYLNGGPGSPAFLYVRSDLQEKLANPLTGWMGQREPFQFSLSYRPEPGMRHFLSGTPPVVALAAVESGVDLLLEAGIARVREKSVRQSEYLIALWRQHLAPLGFRLNSPADQERRGSLVTLGHDEGLRISQAMAQELNVLTDFRQPDNIRLGIAPLYNTFGDIHAGATSLAKVVADRIYGKYPSRSEAVI